MRFAMKMCLKCGEGFVSSDWLCPACGFGPPQRFGYHVFAPEIAERTEGFNAYLFEQFAAIESSHFWFKGRNELIADMLASYFPVAQNLLEIGCGTGVVLAGIRQRFPDISLTGTEALVSGLDYAAKRVADATVFQMDARAIPFDAEFEVIGAFDVLEHIEEDKRVLRQMYRACRQGGGIILTVPQHPFLWSATDEYACHKRRYTRQELVGKVESAGFVVQRVSSFVSLLLPLMVLSRLLQRKPATKSNPIDAGFKIGNPLNRVLGFVLELERFAIKRGASFPMGGSLLLVGRK